VKAVEFREVSKSYAIYDSPGDRLTELLCLNRVRRHRDFLALDRVSFTVERGETFCIVGQNGAGKSTLLELVAGISQPSAGTVAVGGRVSALLELGAGFNPEFTGRDNVYLNAAIHGLNGRQIDERYGAITDFAEIGDFINQPVKTYSSGMAVRLAFAVAIHTEPEILLVDEALAVGDLYFRQKCMRKVHELRARGVTILLVSHAAAERAGLWLVCDASELEESHAAAERRVSGTGIPRAGVGTRTLAGRDQAPKGVINGENTARQQAKSVGRVTPYFARG